MLQHLNTSALMVHSSYLYALGTLPPFKKLQAILHIENSPSPPPCSQILNTHTLVFVEMLLNDVLLSLIYSPFCSQKKMTADLFQK